MTKGGSLFRITHFQSSSICVAAKHLWTFEEGRTGLLARRGNVQELARAIEFLLDHDQERAVMAIHARRRVEEVFPRDGQVQKYFDLYSGLVAKRETSDVSDTVSSRFLRNRSLNGQLHRNNAIETNAKAPNEEVCSSCD